MSERSEMVERIARAICGGLGWPWEDLPQTAASDTQDRCLSAAGDVLGVLREPSDAMVEAAARSLVTSSWGAGDLWEDFGPEARKTVLVMARAAIIAAIDAVLEEKQ